MDGVRRALAAAANQIIAVATGEAEPAATSAPREDVELEWPAAQVWLGMPLDLGLRIDAAAAQGILRRGARTGDPLFDRAFRAHADEDPRAHALLVPELRAALLAAMGEAEEIVVDDASVTLRTEVVGFRSAGGPVEEASQAEQLGRLAKAGRQIANQVDAARRRVPVARVLRQAHVAFSSWAAREGLRCEATPLQVAGGLQGAGVAVLVLRAGFEEYLASLVVNLPRPLGLRGLLALEGSGSAALARSRSLALRPLELARAERVFVGTTADAEIWERIERAVDAGVVRSLDAAARRARDLVLGDRQLAIEQRLDPEAPRELLEVLTAAVELALRLDQSLRLDGLRAGPYR